MINRFDISKNPFFAKAVLRIVLVVVFLFSIVNDNDQPRYLEFCKENKIEIII